MDCFQNSSSHQNGGDEGHNSIASSSFSPPSEVSSSFSPPLEASSSSTPAPTGPSSSSTPAPTGPSSSSTPAPTGPSSSSTPAPTGPSSSSTPLPKQEYAVFLSFRGETRSGFTDHLYKGLKNSGILVFRGKEGLTLGEGNWPELVQAIETSEVSILIISRNYASSQWCLDELVHILKCKKNFRQIVIPIFYQVKPSDIRKILDSLEDVSQVCKQGRFGYDDIHVQEWKDALLEVSFMTGLESEKKADGYGVREWKDALKEVSFMTGLESEKKADGYEGELVEMVITEVIRALDKPGLVVRDDLVGVEDHVEKIRSMVNAEGSSKVRCILIHGMGGIGKTTLAMVAYNQLIHQFDSCSFLADVRETWSRDDGKLKLQKQLISDILGQKQSDIASNVNEGLHVIRERFKHKKVLVVLDDVDTVDQLDTLVGNQNWLGRESMLIVTSRKTDVLNGWEDNFSYELEQNFSGHHRGGDEGQNSSSSLTSTPLSKQQYEVFLSFRGETRRGFTDHLFRGLKNAGIVVFRDRGLTLGERNWPELVQAIETSKVSILIISPNYASSQWCLNELVHILKRKKDFGQIVIPIFYQVKPSDVRTKLDSPEEVSQVCKKGRHGYDDTHVPEWKDALREVSFMTGLESEKEADGYEGKLVEMVITEVIRALDKPALVVSDGLVGVEDHVEKIRSMVNAEGSSKVRCILIHGMGDIGKTTLAMVAYNQLIHQFDSCSFLADVRETWSRDDGKLKLQKQLISDILGQKQSDIVSNVNKGRRVIRERFKHKKVLIVLDDVDTMKQLDTLVGDQCCFGKESMLIVTSRKTDVLNGWQDNFSYELENLNEDQSFRLFCK